MEFDTKEKIVEEIYKRGTEPSTAKDLMEKLQLSYPTITKWLAVLVAEGKIRVSDYGNIKFYYPKENNNNENHDGDTKRETQEGTTH